MGNPSRRIRHIPYPIRCIYPNGSPLLMDTKEGDSRVDVHLNHNMYQYN